ncbi:hypothetical protein DFH09DRAFT_1144632 [Mycena vulgaris]|nr:hypothetical protein DFH09DRAFT_1144632 [Mycena vulgaris]
MSPVLLSRCSPHHRGTRIVLLLLALAALLWIPLTWDSLQSLRLTITAQLSQSQSQSQLPSHATRPAPSLPPPSLTPTITNNNVTYPRRASSTLFPQKAREYIERLNAVRDVAFSPHWKEMQGHNLENVDRLLQYLERAEAGEQLPPPSVVLSSWHFLPTCYETSSNGEVQWMRPLLRLMREQDNIFIIYAAFPDRTFHKDFKRLGNDLVTHTWLDDEHLIWCFQDTEHCMLSAQNPDGVPLHKLFAFTFWGSLPSSGKWLPPIGAPSWSFNPLGREWNLVPYQMPESHFFLGYHYEGCQALPYVPYAERTDQIVVIAKKSSYFHPTTNPLAFPPGFYTRLNNALNSANNSNYTLISNALIDEGFLVPEGLTDSGLLPQKEYDLMLSDTKSLLGIGRPLISPTPYAALCRGVPVVLPYSSKSGCPAWPGVGDWCAFVEGGHQHGPAAALGEPWVYVVDVDGSEEEIIETIGRAVRTPIEPFEPEEMKILAVRHRLLDYFEIDWALHGAAKAKELGAPLGAPIDVDAPLPLPPWLIDWSRRNPDPSLVLW